MNDVYLLADVGYAVVYRNMCAQLLWGVIYKHNILIRTQTTKWKRFIYEF